MASLRIYVALVLLISISVLAAPFENLDSNQQLPAVLRVFLQIRPEEEVAPARHIRVKRQNGVIIDSIFQIPIQTLSAVNNLFKNSVLAFQSWRQGSGPGTGNQSNNNFQSSSTTALQYTGSNFGSNNLGASTYNGGNGYYSNNYYRPPRKYNYQSSAAMRGDLPVKSDGSSYRI